LRDAQGVVGRTATALLMGLGLTACPSPDAPGPEEEPPGSTGMQAVDPDQGADEAYGCGDVCTDEGEPPPDDDDETTTGPGNGSSSGCGDPTGWSTESEGETPDTDTDTDTDTGGAAHADAPRERGGSRNARCG
jgi:hypothetical protein